MLFDYVLVIQIFVLLNPLSSFPFLISAQEKGFNVKLIALQATLVAFIIALIITLTGQTLFSIFGITLDSFRIAGGLVLLLLAYRMVKPREEKHEVIKGIDGLITIIATPMLTGPGTISYITVKSIEIGKSAVLSNLVWAFLFVGGVFFLFSLLVSKIDPKIVNIFSRVLGLFLMAVAVEMIATGMTGIIHSEIIALKG